MKDDGTLRLRTRMEERRPIITQEMYLQHWLVSQASAMIRFYDNGCCWKALSFMLERMSFVILWPLVSSMSMRMARDVVGSSEC